MKQPSSPGAPSHSRPWRDVHQIPHTPPHTAARDKGTTTTMTNDQLTTSVHNGVDTAAFFATLDAVKAMQPEAARSASAPTT